MYVMGLFSTSFSQPRGYLRLEDECEQEPFLPSCRSVDFLGRLLVESCKTPSPLLVVFRKAEETHHLSQQDPAPSV